MFKKIIDRILDILIKQYKLDKVLNYVEKPNELDKEVDELKEQIIKLEAKAHAPRDFVICEMCKEKIKEK